MKILGFLRKTIGYVLMSMGASSSDAVKKKPGTKTASKTGQRT